MQGWYGQGSSPELTETQQRQYAGVDFVSRFAMALNFRVPFVMPDKDLLAMLQFAGGRVQLLERVGNGSTAVELPLLHLRERASREGRVGWNPPPAYIWIQISATGLVVRGKPVFVKPVKEIVEVAEQDFGWKWDGQLTEIGKYWGMPPDEPIVAPTPGGLIEEMDRLANRLRTVEATSNSDWVRQTLLARAQRAIVLVEGVFLELPEDRLSRVERVELEAGVVTLRAAMTAYLANLG
jgi:hypothetical protein